MNNGDGSCGVSNCMGFRHNHHHLQCCHLLQAYHIINIVVVNQGRYGRQDEPYRNSLSSFAFMNTPASSSTAATDVTTNPNNGIIDNNAFNAVFATSSQQSRFGSLSVSTEPRLNSTKKQQNRDDNHVSSSRRKSSSSFQCPHCPKTVASRYSMKRHLLIHSGERPYKICKVCESAFRSRDNLKQHERRHSGQRPFKCKVCGQAFAQSSTLKCHERTHSKEKSYRCQVSGCRRAFAHLSNKLQHERSSIHANERRFEQAAFALRNTVSQANNGV